MTWILWPVSWWPEHYRLWPVSRWPQQYRLCDLSADDLNSTGCDPSVDDLNSTDRVTCQLMTWTVQTVWPVSLWPEQYRLWPVSWPEQYRLWPVSWWPEQYRLWPISWWPEQCRLTCQLITWRLWLVSWQPEQCTRQCVTCPLMTRTETDWVTCPLMTCSSPECSLRGCWGLIRNQSTAADGWSASWQIKPGLSNLWKGINLVTRSVRAWPAPACRYLALIPNRGHYTALQPVSLEIPNVTAHTHPFPLNLPPPLLQPLPFGI